PEAFRDAVAKQNSYENKRIQYVCFTRAVNSFYTPIGREPLSISCNEYYQNICPQLENIAQKNNVLGFEVIEPDIKNTTPHEGKNVSAVVKLIQKHQVLNAGSFYTKNIFIQSYSSLTKKSKSAGILEEKLN